MSLFNVSEGHVIQPLHWTNIAAIISFDQLQQPMHILERAHVNPVTFSCTFSSLSISSSILTLLGVLELTLPSDSTPGHKCSLCLPFRRVLACTSTCQCNSIHRHPCHHLLVFAKELQCCSAYGYSLSWSCCIPNSDSALCRRWQLAIFDRQCQPFVPTIYIF